MFGNLTLLAMAKRQMDWAARRQEVLAENVANADTPGYRPKDAKPLDFKQALQRSTAVQPAATHPRHVATSPLLDATNIEVVSLPPEASPDGNAVMLEDQMQKVGETRSAYELAATLFQKNIRMLKTAIGRGGGN